MMEKGKSEVYGKVMVVIKPVLENFILYIRIKRCYHYIVFGDCSGGNGHDDGESIRH